MVARRVLQLVALVACLAPATAASGACEAVRCYNTVPESCCPANFIDAKAIGATQEQAMTLALEVLQVGALRGACTQNCSAVVFGSGLGFPGFVESCLTTQGLFPSNLQQVYRSSASLCSGYCGILKYSEERGEDFTLLEIPTVCSAGESPCSTECRNLLEVVDDADCRGRMTNITTFGLGARIAQAYDDCGIAFNSNAAADSQTYFLVNAAAGADVMPWALLAAVGAAALALLL